MNYFRVFVRTTLVAALLCALLTISGLLACGDAITQRLSQEITKQTIQIPLNQWKFHQPAIADGEAENFDDSGWQTVAPGFQWMGENTEVWFRTRYVVPDTVRGYPTEGMRVRLSAGMDDYAEVYLNGKYLMKFHWDEGLVTLTDHAHPGDVFNIALKGINTLGDGQLRKAELVFDPASAYQRYITDTNFIQQIIPQLSPALGEKFQNTLSESEKLVDLDAVRKSDWVTAEGSIAKAEKVLMSLAPITNQYKVFYVAHSHMDMCWLWDWQSTMDTAYNTWDSTLHMMDQFHHLGFVQSQPSIYLPVEKYHPAEFAHMLSMQKKGQWDLVGGLWDESDTNMPSGEGLAMSFFFGQRYFHSRFGQYAVTGWLPDSFGHSWQLPQISREAGIKYFYHMRCGDGIPFSWWESPDGSRLLKANTDNYDEPVVPEQLTRPFANAKNWGLKQALVVFGVGDHGGGPTREQIMNAKDFQHDPLFPKVQFDTADKFFEQLAKNPASKTFPVIDTDLQYTFTGCYTSHEDVKKEVRSSENNLYAGQAFASMADMTGVRYPLQGFQDAWMPTIFAQFHDIMCGTAIHSTYVWLRKQFEPAFTFEKKELGAALSSLTSTTNTNGARTGERPVVVWNSLSFPVTNVVKFTVSDPSLYHSVRDKAGHYGPVQALDSHTLVFIANDVPAFGRQVYFLSRKPYQGDDKPGVSVTSDRIILSNPFERVTFNKNTGLIVSLYDKRIHREMIQPGKSGNLIQELGDNGSAWDFNYTGVNTDLTTPSSIKLISQGPVCAILQVRSNFGKSSITQNYTVYNSIPRLDIPTTINWHDLAETLKAAFSLNMKNPTVRVEIPYGSISRPTNGQEYPGQKWMDVTDQQTIGNKSPQYSIDIRPYLNQDSTDNFDGSSHSFAVHYTPAPGWHTVGTEKVRVHLAPSGNMDDISCARQIISVPKGANGNTLYVLATATNGVQAGAITFVYKNGKEVTQVLKVNDWVMGGGDNESVFVYDKWDEGVTLANSGMTHIWMTSITNLMNEPIAKIVLPSNPNIHIFAMTLTNAPEEKPLYGISILNNCKYGADTINNLFRLTLLRSSTSPDPNPEEGMHTFTYSLLPHAGDWRTVNAEERGLELNVPLQGVATSPHSSRRPYHPFIRISPSNVVAGALMHSQDSAGYILRIFETAGRDTTVHLHFDHPVRIQETDILERPIHKHVIHVRGGDVTFRIGHDQIVTLHITGLPDAGVIKQIKGQRYHVIL